MSVRPPPRARSSWGRFSTRCPSVRSWVPCPRPCAASRTTRARSRPAAASSRSAGFVPTGTASSPRRSSVAPGRSWRSLPTRCRGGRGADPGPGYPPGAAVAGRRLLRASLPGAHRRGHHGDEREDHDVLSLRSPSPGSGSRHGRHRDDPVRRARAGPRRPARRRPRRSSSRGSWPRWWRPGSAASPWRCPPTLWRSTAWTASGSTWPCSRTSPRTISTSTGRCRVRRREAPPLLRAPVGGRKPGATAVLNADDPVGAEWAAALPGRVLTFGLRPGHAIRPLEHESGLEGIRLARRRAHRGRSGSPRRSSASTT